MTHSGVYLAFRRTAPVGAPWWHRVLSALVRWRLVSQWCHAGIVCDGVLYHVTATGGLTYTDDWTPSRWDLFALPETARSRLQAVLTDYAGARYDWFSLLAFLLPGRWSDHHKLYCFELLALVLGVSTRKRVTPEKLLVVLVSNTNSA